MKLLIADDHGLFREGIRHVLAQLGDDVEIVETSNGEEAVRIAGEQADLDLVLLDLHMPGLDGLSALALLVERHPTLPVVVLSASENPADMQQALDAGAMGFIPKATTASVMIGALRLVFSGGIYIPPEMLRPARSAPASTMAPAAASDTARLLTPRQLDVLALLVRGEPNKRIATRLGLSEATVKAHVTAVLRALSASNRTQAAAMVDRLGITLPRVD